MCQNSRIEEISYWSKLIGALIFWFMTSMLFSAVLNLFKAKTPKSSGKKDYYFWHINVSYWNGQSNLRVISTPPMDLLASVAGKKGRISPLYKLPLDGWLGDLPRPGRKGYWDAWWEDLAGRLRTGSYGVPLTLVKIIPVIFHTLGV